VIDSPGGTVAGTRDLADEVARAAKQKPVVAYIEDLGASAAYWIASQANKIYANPTAIVGSIGTYGVICDFSAQAAMIGVKVHVLRAGQFKGAGEPGTEITPEQLAEWQRIVDQLNEHFVRGVAAGRKGLSLAAVRELADGRAHVGEAAVTLGLVDGVQSFDATLQQFSSSGKRRTKPMSSDTDNVQAQDTPPTPPPLPAAADYDELVAACPGADEKFVCSQLAAKATVAQATSAWMKAQNDRLQAQRADLEKARAAAAAPGVDPLGSKQAAGDDDEAGDPVAQFNELVAKKIAAGMPRRKAVFAVAKANKHLHQAFLAATNKPTSKVQELIRERFELVD